MARKKWLWKGAASAGAAVGVSVWWRYAARKRSLPCPSWAAGVLVHPFSHLVPPSLDKLEVAPGMRVLDVGCGPGRLSIPMAEAGATVVSLDLQPGMLRRLRQRASGTPNVLPVRADITRSPLRADFFDRAVLVTVLGEIPAREAALRAIFAALKPGGVLSITEIMGDPHYQSRRTVSQLAAGAGFKLHRDYDGLLAFTMNFIKPA
jgi:SAM-dependent methyltransferase